MFPGVSNPLTLYSQFLEAKVVAPILVRLCRSVFLGIPEEAWENSQFQAFLFPRGGSGIPFLCLCCFVPTEDGAV